jgi:hypothetical protein
MVRLDISLELRMVLNNFHIKHVQANTHPPGPLLIRLVGLQ